jgi:hypothetical protein
LIASKSQREERLDSLSIPRRFLEPENTMAGVNPTTTTTMEQASHSWRRLGPVITLLVLSPVIAELLFGAIRISTLFAMIPATGAWGCGALLIRDFVRRRKQGWSSLALFAAALAVAEECIIQQTSFAPLVGVDPSHAYGREFGVNWVYFLWAVGYESVWAVVIPILLTEVLFPNRRKEPWLRRRGLTITATVFLCASFAAWYFWTQIFVPQFFPESAYDVPLVHVTAACAVIASLVAAAICIRPKSSSQKEAPPPVQRPWPLAIAGFTAGILWFMLVYLAYGLAPAVPPAIPLASGLAIGGVSLLGIKWWNDRFGWSDVNALALILGALAASMLAGFPVLYGSSASLIDYVGKAVLNVLATSAMVLLLVRSSRSLVPTHGI